MPRGMSYGPNWFPVAVQALVILAGSDHPCSSNTMAQDLRAHAVFLRRVLIQLVRANLIEAREGRDGGYRLARAAEQITLAEIYQAVKVTASVCQAADTDGVDARVETLLAEIGAEAERHLLAILDRVTLATVLVRLAGTAGPEFSPETSL
jgi:Rrf2 family transcriptional repressor of oqxAB